MVMQLCTLTLVFSGIFSEQRAAFTLHLSLTGDGTEHLRFNFLQSRKLLVSSGSVKLVYPWASLANSCYVANNDILINLCSIQSFLYWVSLKQEGAVTFLSTYCVSGIILDQLSAHSETLRCVIMGLIRLPGEISTTSDMPMVPL